MEFAENRAGAATAGWRGLLTRRPKVVWLLPLAAVVGLSIVFYGASVHAFSATSDGATVVLEGAAVSHGHLTLGDWSLSLDSFWSIDVLFYAVAVLIAGVRASLMHLIPAVLAALVIVVGTVIVVRGQHGRQRLVAMATIVAILVLPSHALAFFLLQGPWHVGTVLYCLIAMALLARAGFGWRWLVAVALLAAGLLGDLQALAIGVVPVFLAGVVAALRCRSRRSGASTAIAAPTAIVLAVVVRLLASALGTFRVAESHHTVSVAQLETNASNFISWTSALLGVHQGAFGGPKISRLLEAPHLLEVAAILVAVVMGSVHLVRGAAEGPRASASSSEEWRLDDLLLLGFLASVAVFGVLTLSNNVSYARYLDAVVIFGALLAARFLGRLSVRASRPVLALASVAGLISIGSSAGILAIELSAAAPSAPTGALETFLADHGLHQGIGDYWAASVVTVDTSGKIRVRPVVANLKGKIVSDGRSATSRWYGGKQFSFLVYDQQPYGRVEPATIAQTFGTPAHTYRVGEYSVDVWSHPLFLGPETFP